VPAGAPVAPPATPPHQRPGGGAGPWSWRWSAFAAFAVAALLVGCLAGGGAAALLHAG
jgi:hypothetical protein